MKLVFLFAVGLWAWSPAIAQDTLFSGSFINHNCFSGDSFRFDSTGAFEHHGWSDAIIGNHPHHLHKGERGTYIRVGEALILDYESIIVDSVAWRDGADEDWLVDPEEWFDDLAAKVQHWSDTLFVRTVGAETVVFSPEYSDEFNSCSDFLLRRPEVDQCDAVNYPEECHGIFRSRDP